MYSSRYWATSILVLMVATTSQAWGTLGHKTVALIAQNYVSAETEAAIQDILGSTRSDYMANVSIWADSYRYTDAGSWSRVLHYTDAQDAPPDSCSIDYDRDCGEDGCSVSAIVNSTNILLDGDATAALKLDAMRFLIHFMGDLHQPLHNEALATGGNDINVTYAGDETNLHHIWDTEMVEHLAAGQNETELARNLTASIDAGDYDWQIAEWLSGATLDDPLATITAWAQEANGYVCSEVIPDGREGVEEQELSGSYYNAHFDVVQVQIARAGFRLGAWLNLVMTGKCDS